MKKILLLGFLVYMISVVSVYATPIINSVTIDPESSWIGQDVNIELNCTDENNTIDNVTLEVQGPSVSYPYTLLSKSGNVYTISIGESDYLDEVGTYILDMSCNGQYETTSSVHSLIVSELTSEMVSVVPDPPYMGDDIDVNIFVYKDGEKITSDVIFDVLLNGQIVISNKPAPKHIQGYFILTIPSEDVPSNPGIYPLKITAYYEGNSVIVEHNMEVQKQIDFDLISVDKEIVRSGDIITAKVKAVDRGNKILISVNHLEISVDTVSVDIEKLTENGDYYDVEMVAPSMSPGNYDLNVKFTYDSFTETEDEEISYGVEVEGQALDVNKGESFELFFKAEDGKETKLSVNNNGEYTGFLASGIYDITLKHPKSILTLDNVNIDDFDDPIKYVYKVGPTIRGMSCAGLLIYEIALDYDSYELEIEYDDRKAYDETELLIYQCDNWNSGLDECVSEWDEIVGSLDTVRNTMTIEDEGLSTFIIGNRETLKLDMNQGTLTFDSGDSVAITGIVTNSRNQAITEADVKLFKNGNEVDSLKSGNDGIFTFSFIPNEEEGSFDYVVKAIKEPYVNIEEKITIDIVKKKSISILIPDTIRVKLGDSVITKATVVNSGQTEFNDITMQISGIEDIFYSLPETSIVQLLPGETQEIEITFSAPQDSELTTYSLTFKAESGDTSKEKLFALTIINDTTVSMIQEKPDKEEPFTFPSISFPTGFVLIPDMGNTNYLILFAFIAFSAAFIMRRRKGTGQREEIKHLFNDLIIEVNRSENTDQPVRRKATKKRPKTSAKRTKKAKRRRQR